MEDSPTISRRLATTGGGGGQIAGSQVSMVQKPGRTYQQKQRPPPPPPPLAFDKVVVADVSSSSDVDFERDRSNMRRKSVVEAPFNTVADASTVSAVAATAANHDDDDINELISAFGLSPEARRKRVERNGIGNKANGIVVRRRTNNSGDSSNSGVGGNGSTLKDRLPRFSNFDVNAGSNSLASGEPRRFSVYPKSWQQRQLQELCL